MNTSTGLDPTATNYFLVCGLGSLGQYCVALLKEFGVKVIGIDAVETRYWEVANIPEQLDELIIGDCCQAEVLEQAKIRQCRTILLVTSDERVNIAAAFAARSLNPNVRLVIRSAQENLNELLAKQLGNFAAYEPTQLPASAFALTALGDTTQGFFSLEHNFLRVVKETIQPGHRWCDRRQLHELNTLTRRLLTHTSNTASPSSAFHQWEPDVRVRAGDTITYIETAEKHVRLATPVSGDTNSWWRSLAQSIAWQTLKQRLYQLWQSSNQPQRVAMLSGLVMVCLFLIGTILFKLQFADISLQDALRSSLILLLGGFGDLFGDIQPSFKLAWWLYLFGVIMTVAGTLFIGILYALLTERVLASRFQFLKRRPPIPKSDHIVLIGLGRVGQQVAALLQELKHPLVGMSSLTLDPEVLPQMPLVTGKTKDALERVNLATAKSVVVVTDDEVANLEIGLMARAVNPNCHLVIRAVDPRFGENVARLLPDARVLGAYALAAEAFVAAAFGENILSLFRLNDRTTMVTEYQIEANDTLNGKLLGEVAYGYGVVPILYQKGAMDSARLMPSDDMRLQVGDRLVVLATIAGLQAVEQGKSLERCWLVRVERAMSQDSTFEGAGVTARVSGCDFGFARILMDNLPGILDYPLYKHQALRLVRELGKVQVGAYLVPNPNKNDPFDTHVL